MDTQTQDPLPTPDLVDSSLSRRGFLRGAAIAGGGLVAASIAACSPVATAGWTYGPTTAPSGAAPAASAAASATAAPAASATAAAVASAGHSMEPSVAPASAAPSASPIANMPPGWTAHDIAARDKVRRYLGDLVKALPAVYPAPVVAKLADILGVEDDYPALSQKPAFVQVPQLVLSDALTPLKPTMEGDVKVFKLTVDEFEQKIDEIMPPVAALGYNGQWPGPTIRVNQGDKVRAVFTNNLKETTSVHFHGVEFDDFFQDGVPFVTQKPIVPGETYAYDFVARNAGSMMYHSHHNATDQVGRGLLGAFIVDPKPEPVAYDRDYIWISNDELGGFTINGHGVPGDRPGPGRAGRDGARPVHERGDHDAPVAPARAADARHRPRWMAAWVGGVHDRHPRRQSR